MIAPALAGGTGRPPAHAAATSAWVPQLAYAAMRLLLAFLALVSTSAFHEKLFGGIPPESLQQPITVAAWIMVIASSFMVPRLRSLSAGLETVAVVAFFGFAVFSVLWSNHAEVSFLKGFALGLTTLGAYRVAVTVRVDHIVAAATGGLVAAAAISLLLVALVPEVGTAQYWMHQGQWNGVYQSKQALGATGAALMFLAACRYGLDRRALRFAITFSLAIACVLGSGSRGGGAIALAGIACLLLARFSGRWAIRLAFGPLVFLTVALLLVTYFIATGSNSIEVFGTSINITERTFIWAHAFKHYDQSFLFGYGLNGFWTEKQILTEYHREHGWVLDDFHSGYISILVETGAVGMSLFALMQTLVSTKLAILVRSRAIGRWEQALHVGFFNTMFLINLTETGFLRSTNFLSVLLVALTFLVCVCPRRSGHVARSADARP